MAKIYAIPGWGFQAEIFLESELMNKFDIIALNYINYVNINNRNHVNVPGKNEHPIQSVNHSIEQLAALLSKQLPNNAIVLGWSLGGLIAIKLAALFPNKVSSLILISSQAKFLFHSFHSFHSPAHSGIPANLFATFITNLKRNFEEQSDLFLRLVNYPNRNPQIKNILAHHFVRNLKVWEKESMISQLSILLSSDMTLDSHAISAKVLQIINVEDAVIKQNSHYLKLSNPKSIITEIPKAGHAGFLSHGKIYQDIIMDFISR